LTSEELTIAAGLVWHEGRILITRRKPEAHLGSYWEFPGGKVISGESLQAAVRREVFEEVGLLVQVGEVFHQETARYPERTVHLNFFNCTKEDPGAIASPLEVSALTWVEIDALGQYTFPNGNANLIKRLSQLSK